VGPIYLPGGEVYAPAVEDSARGALAFSSWGTPYRMRIEGGLPVDLTGGTEPRRRALSDSLRLGTEPLCEVGIGTNPRAAPLEVGALVEKALGTAHVAFGANTHFGGVHAGPVHADLVIASPDIDVDGRMLLRSGRLEP
jgi:leucyl aminopeptidase (aminopeptidase T)